MTRERDAAGVRATLSGNLDAMDTTTVMTEAITAPIIATMLLLLL
jgi:hypothetical protein